MKKEIVKVVITTTFALFLLWVVSKITHWLIPQHEIFGIVILVILAIDYALIISGKRKHGLFGKE
jgi:hypothetical protein